MKAFLEKAGWYFGCFAPNGAYIPKSYAVPKEVDSVVNHRIYRNKDIVVQVAGGVTTNAMAAAKDAKLKSNCTRTGQCRWQRREARLNCPLVAGGGIRRSNEWLLKIRSTCGK